MKNCAFLLSSSSFIVHSSLLAEALMSLPNSALSLDPSITLRAGCAQDIFCGEKYGLTVYPLYMDDFNSCQLAIGLKSRL